MKFRFFSIPAMAPVFAEDELNRFVANEQLAEMVRRRITTPQALAAIEGIGEARLSRYGPAFLEILVAGVPLLGSADASAPDPLPGAGPAGSDR